MLFYIYSDSTASTIDITSRCRVGRLSVKDQAEEGAVAISSLIIDDPDGDLVITGHRRMYIYESDAPILDQVIFNGFVVNERVERGPYRTGAGRQWTVDLADPNVFINRRIMNGADANRPAETDLARIQALLTMTELNTVDDDTYVSTTAATTNMDAVDYRGQNVGAYIDDCRQASGKNAYIRYNETLGQYGLWYDFDYSTAYDSACFLTNTASEADNSTIFLYSQERTYLNRDPSRVASGIYLEYDGGTVYVQDAGTLAEFAAIDWASPSINVKTLAAATARANRYLEDASTEHKIIHTVLTKVPRAKVNKIKKGHLVSFKGAWVPDFESYIVGRVLYRTVTEISEDPQASFEIELDIDPMGTPSAPIVPFSILYGAHSGGTVPSSVSPIYFGGSGDAPQSPYAPAPTIGPVTIVPRVPVIAAEAVQGWTINGTGTINLLLHSTISGVPLAGDVYTVAIRKNGVSVGSDSVTCSVNFFWVAPSDIDITVTALAVVPGDFIEAVESSAPRTGFSAPAGAGDTTVNFSITGGSLVLP